MMLLNLALGVAVMFFNIIIVVELMDDYINSYSKIRWKELKRKKDTVYVIEKQYLYFFWGQAFQIGKSGYPEEIIFDMKEDAVRFVDVHKIRKEFNKKK